MAFQPLSTSNTFSQWITDKQRAISVLNQFTDGSNTSTFYTNTNISVGDDLTVGGNLTVRGLFVLDDTGYNDLSVAGNLNVVQSITTTNGVFANLNVLNNVITLNTSAFRVGTNANLSSLSVFDTLSVGNIVVSGSVTGSPNLFVPNLVVTQNVENLNVTSELYVGLDANVYGDLLACLRCRSELSLTGDLSANIAFIGIATINTLIGTANTNIYNSISTSNAATSLVNTLAEFASLSCILG
jgi:hypothetical protein